MYVRDIMCVCVRRGGGATGRAGGVIPTKLKYRILSLNYTLAHTIKKNDYSETLRCPLSY